MLREIAKERIRRAGKKIAEELAAKNAEIAKKEIAKLKPGIAFFRDDAFVDDSARTNLQQVFNQFSPTTSIKVI